MYYLPLIMSSFLLFSKKITTSTKVLILFLLTSVIVTFRFGAGTDYFSYYYLYQTLDTRSLHSFLLTNTNIEVGFKILQYLFQSLSISYHVSAVIIGLVTLALITKWILDSSDNPVLSFLIFYAMFFLVWILSAQRQGLVLALSLYLFYNPKVDLKLKTKVIILILLASIHISVLFVLPFLFIDRVDWNKKNLLLIFGISLVISYIPINEVLALFTFIPDKFVGYFQPPTSLLSFPNLIRILFFMFVWFFYESLSISKFSKKITDSFLLGLSLYFMLSFSGIGAARIAIYTFTLIVLIFPIVLDKFDAFKILSRLGLGALLIYSLVFFQKEASAYIAQSGYTEESAYLKFESILNKDFTKFNDLYPKLVHDQMNCNTLLDEAKERLNSLDRAVYAPNDIYTVVYDRESYLYGVVNQRGEILIDPVYEQEPMVYGNILYFEDETMLDLTGGDRSSEELVEVFLREWERLIYYNEVPAYFTSSLSYEDLPSEVKAFAPFQDKIRDISMASYQLPKDITLINFNYFGFDYTAYTDHNGLLIHKGFSFTNYRPSYTGFTEINSQCGKYTINSDGSIIWYR